jgi:hypothetical protein
MAQKRKLVIDAYNVIKVFRELDVSFEEIAALGCRIQGEPQVSVTPALLAVWFEEEKKEREAGTAIGRTSPSKKDD